MIVFSQHRKKKESPIFLIIGIEQGLQIQKGKGMDVYAILGEGYSPQV